MKRKNMFVAMVICGVAQSVLAEPNVFITGDEKYSELGVVRTEKLDKSVVKTGIIATREHTGNEFDCLKGIQAYYSGIAPSNTQYSATFGGIWLWKGERHAACEFRVEIPSN